jgi:hypothetical protein
MEQRYTKFLSRLGRSLRSCAQIGRQHEEGRVARKFMRLGAAATAMGASSFPNTMEAALLGNPQPAGALLALVCSKSGVQHTRKEGSLENSCGPARASPRTRPCDLSIIVPNTME